MQKLIPFSASLLATVILLELTSRVLFPHSWDPPSAKSLFYHTANGPRMRANRVAYSPTSSISNRATTLRTNSLGLRGPEPSKDKAIIAFLGDSVTLSDYTEEEETFVYKINTLFENDRLPYQALNAGVSGLSLAQEISLLKEILSKQKLHTVVVNFYLNDATGCCHLKYIHTPWPLSASRFVQTALHAYATHSLHRERYENDIPEKALVRIENELTQLISTSKSRDSKDFYTTAKHESFAWGNTFAPTTWNYLKEEFEELHKLQRKHDLKISLVAHPTDIQILTPTLFNYPQQRLNEIAKGYDWPYLDLLPLYRETPKKSVKEYFFDRGHLTPKGQTVVAYSIYQHIHQFL